MHPEVDELRPKLKEILYDCAVEIRATKAALYLWDGQARYELASEYGFRSAVRQSLDKDDPIVDRCERGRNAFFVNGLAVEPRFSEILYEASTDRLLAAPIYNRGQMVGFIDMRDKAGKQPFDQTDLPKAQRIGERIGSLFTNSNVFGIRFITLSETEDAARPAAIASPAGAKPGAPVAPRPAAEAPAQQRVAAPPPPPGPAPAQTASPLAAAPPVAAPSIVVQPPPQPRPAAGAPSSPATAVPSPQEARPRAVEPVPAVASVVVAARKAAGHIILPSPPESLSEAELVVIRDVLKSMLLIPGVLVASFSAFEQMGGVQEVAAKAPLSDEAVNVLQSKLNIWLTKRGESTGMLSSNVQVAPGVPSPPILAGQLQKVFTAPVTIGALRGLYLTVAFADTPDRAQHELLASNLNQLQLAAESSISRVALQTMRIRVAEKLLEPEFSSYPELKRHTGFVVKLTEQFGRHLGVTPRDADLLKIVAIVHDVGLRLLDYDRLYTRRDLTSEELNLLHEHAAVGAAMIEPLLGNEVARAVLCHHERVDGRGYPNELHGEEIPFVSRVVQICDAYVAISDPKTYQPHESQDDALAAISRGAGAQFDNDLARKFIDMMRAGKPS